MKIRLALLAVAAAAGMALTSGAASAMPNGLQGAQSDVKAGTAAEQVRYVCNAWGRCWWRPNYYGGYGYYGYGGPRYYGYGYGPRFYGGYGYGGGWGWGHRGWGGWGHRW